MRRKKPIIVELVQLSVCKLPPASDARCVYAVGGGPNSADYTSPLAQPVGPSASVVASDPPSADFSQPPASDIPPPGAAAPEALPAAPEEAPSAPPAVPAGPQEGPPTPPEEPASPTGGSVPSEALVTPSEAPDNGGGGGGGEPLGTP